jgi:hypothetical protein
MKEADTKPWEELRNIYKILVRNMEGSSYFS